MLRLIFFIYSASSRYSKDVVLINWFCLTKPSSSARTAGNPAYNNVSQNILRINCGGTKITSPIHGQRRLCLVPLRQQNVTSVRISLSWISNSLICFLSFPITFSVSDFISFSCFNWFFLLTSCRSNKSKFAAKTNSKTTTYFQAYLFSCHSRQQFQLTNNNMFSEELFTNFKKIDCYICWSEIGDP